MDRDDIAVGVGGEGGISSNGTIQENVGGYLPIIDQGLSTVGDCRYRQSIPLNQNGRLDIDTTLGVSKEFLPQVRVVIKTSYIINPKGRYLHTSSD